jgi:hypothetical protein
VALDRYREQADLRAADGDRPLGNVIDEAIAAREGETGIREEILAALEDARVAMGDDVAPLLRLESLWGRRSLDYIGVAYNTGYEHGRHSQLPDRGDQHDLARRLADWLRDQRLDDREVTTALLAVLTSTIRGQP